MEGTGRKGESPLHHGFKASDEMGMKQGFCLESSVYQKNPPLSVDTTIHIELLIVACRTGTQDVVGGVSDKLIRGRERKGCTPFSISARYFDRMAEQARYCRELHQSPDRSTAGIRNYQAFPKRHRPP